MLKKSLSKRKSLWFLYCEGRGSRREGVHSTGHIKGIFGNAADRAMAFPHTKMSL